MTRLYDKRIMFLVPKKHVTYSGGTGSFTKSFLEMAENMHWCVDLVLNRPLGDKENDMLKDLALEHNIYTPTVNEYLPTTQHNNMFVFKDAINMETVINFQSAMMKALSENSYDMVLSNVPDATLAAQHIGISDYIPVVHYTHNESSIHHGKYKDNTFRKCYNDYLKDLFSSASIYCGTQSQTNVDIIEVAHSFAKVHLLPMPVPERGLLNPSYEPKDGVMFIGRCENRKNPKEFVRAIAESGLNAKVLTKGKDVKKWEHLFAEAGVTNYEIKFDISGQEKVDYIKSAKVAYHPSKLESYGFSAFETLHSCPTVCLKKYVWWESFKKFDVYATTTEDVTLLLKELHEQPWNEDWQMTGMVLHDYSIPRYWHKFLIDAEEAYKKFVPYQLKPGNLKDALQNGIVKLKDYNISLGRQINIEDVDVISKKKYALNVKYTKSDTYLSMDKIVEDDISEDANTQDLSSVFQ